jgi:putative ABC transport system permease protein
MELRPILSAMLRNKTGVILVGLQIALTLAVLANAAFIIVQRVERIHRPPGIDSPNLIFATSYGFGPNYDHRDTVRRDLDMLRAIPGVIAVTVTDHIPMSGGGSGSKFGATPDARKSNTLGNNFSVGEDAVKAFGVKLVAGRGFTEQEVQFNPDANNSDFVPAVIVTEDFAHDMFGEEPALGKRVYDGLGNSAVIVGVMENMINAWISSEKTFNVIFEPRIPAGPQVRYAIRTEPGRIGALLPEIERKLAESNQTRAIVSVRPHSYYVEHSYRPDSRMVVYLTVIIVLMIAITALGIVGLASFHVNVRTKQIGTRRAIGARRLDIIRYFMIENWLLTTGGVLLGTLFAFAFANWLTSVYDLPRLQPFYVFAGVPLLWILGQLAVIVPARRAAAIPPAIATRTV